MNPYSLLITLSLSLIGDNQINHKITFSPFCVNHKIKIIVHCQKHQLCFNLHHSYYRTSCRELAYKVSAQLDHVRLQSKCLIKIGWISKLLFREVVNFSDLSILFLKTLNYVSLNILKKEWLLYWFFFIGFKVFKKRKKIYNNRRKSSGQEFHKCSLDTMFSIERKV
jgi:hypothetical protein